ncbi:FHA domain-containing protein [Cephalotus follicularis]|uniref:FHA domain-containing protein n=1 Tax=Cephalotus follicularis TaxID=3775 RepID=A0A1Q3B1Q8_CEPFO|nr:FHA domain-containing protein [Cephalotus follicularis]
MVWGLFPADPLSGEDDNYYIFTKGTYKVGRKGCDVIITKDKGVSRIHAEIVVDAMTFLNPWQKESLDISSKVRIRDCSKYGTFITNNLGSKEKVHEFPNKETTIKEGDLVSFGTGNATYRFCFVPLLFFVCCSEPSHVNHLLEDKVSSIGARISLNWSEECTHVLVDQLMPMKEDLVKAFVAKKPFVLSSWVEFVTEKSIRTEIPSFNSFAPLLTVEGVSIKVADPKAREMCLEGYTFLLEATDKYETGNNLWPLLEIGGAKIISIEGFCANSLGSVQEEKNRVACVIPKGTSDKCERFNKFCTLSRVNEMDLICAVISGHLDPSLFISPHVVVPSSCSTDETVVADSDAEQETATSRHAPAPVCNEESSKCDRKVNESVDHVANIPEGRHVTRLGDDNRCITARRDKFDESETGNIDIIYSQDLMVRHLNIPANISSAAKNEVLNFKRFRKTNTQSGNSFNNLIPFSKYPYKDSECRTEEMAECVKEEKKRKQREAMAEDLFNNEKGRRGRVSASLHGYLIRS